MFCQMFGNVPLRHKSNMNVTNFLCFVLNCRSALGSSYELMGYLQLEYIRCIPEVYFLFRLHPNKCAPCLKY